MLITHHSVTTTRLVLEIEEPEAREVLVDATPLQTAIREALAQANRERNPQGRSRTGGKSIHFGKAHNSPKAAARAAAKTAQCPKCEGLFHPKGLTKHLNRCPGKVTAPAVE